MESLLKSLREQYQSSDFEAVKTSLIDNKDAFDKGEFHYNLGTVYSKTGNYAVGRYHLEKAVYEGYDTAATKHNLKIVKDKLSTQDLSTSQSIDDVLLSKSISYGPDFFIFVTLIFLVVSIVLFNKKVVKRWGVAILILLSLTPITAKHFYLDNLNIAVLFNDSNVYEGPSGIFEKTGEIPKGAKVLVGKTIDGWFFIERPVEYVGWIKMNDVGILK
ncbi:MAG: hypothetical protein CME70_07885 [Halobacteriovorax sp.]|nr:hypothetical protein [Halobacteriovorax sp.]